MKHKINNVRFIVNEKKRTVTCITEGYIDSTYTNFYWDYLSKKSNILDKNFWFSYTDRLSSSMAFRAIKTTKCLDEDFVEGEWTRTGKKIAYAKCMEKIYTEIIKLHWIIDRAFNEELNASWAKYVNKIDGIECKIAKLTGTNNENN